MILFHTPETSNCCILILCPHEIHSSNEEKCHCIHISYGFCIMTWVNWRLSLLRESQCQWGVSNQVSEVHIACWTLPKGRGFCNKSCNVGFSNFFLSEIRKSRIFLRRLRKIKRIFKKDLKAEGCRPKVQGWSRILPLPTWWWQSSGNILNVCRLRCLLISWHFSLVSVPPDDRDICPHSVTT